MRTHNRRTNGDGRDLVDAVRSGNLDEVKRLLGAGASEHFMDETHKMALMVASEEGLTEMVELLDRQETWVQWWWRTRIHGTDQSFALGSSAGGKATP